MKKKLICILLAAILTAGAGTSEMVSAARTSFATEQADNLQAAAEEPTENLTELTDITLITTKHSSKAIRLRWKDFSDELVSEYYVMRRGVKTVLEAEHGKQSQASSHRCFATPNRYFHS